MTRMPQNISALNNLKKKTLQKSQSLKVRFKPKISCSTQFSSHTRARLPVPSCFLFWNAWMLFFHQILCYWHSGYGNCSDYPQFLLSIFFSFNFFLGGGGGETTIWKLQNLHLTPIVIFFPCLPRRQRESSKIFQVQILNVTCGRHAEHANNNY